VSLLDFILLKNVSFPGVLTEKAKAERPLFEMAEESVIKKKVS